MKDFLFRAGTPKVRTKKGKLMKKSLIGLLLVVALIAAACGSSLEGEEVLIFGAPATDGPDGKAIQAAMDEFSAETGIIVTYVGSENFEQEIQVQME